MMLQWANNAQSAIIDLFIHAFIDFEDIKIRTDDDY